jgi:hypothetical protein
MIGSLETRLQAHKSNGLSAGRLRSFGSVEKNEEQGWHDAARAQIGAKRTRSTRMKE